MTPLYISCVYLITLVILCQKSDSTENKNFTVEYQWNYVNFTWPDQDAYQRAVKNSEYIPQNVAMAGIKIYDGKIYIAMPRVRKGVPVTLGHITLTDSSKHNALVTPFEKINNFEDCKNLQSVQSMEIDKDGVMWVLDGFRVNYNKCPPKLVLFDLKENGKVLQSYEFPNETCLQSGGFLNDIVVDDSAGGGFAYITDNSNIDPGLIIFSRSQNRAWKIRDSTMFGEIDASNFIVDGRNFTKLSAIDGIALSPSDVKTGERDVYYCSLTGFNLYSISNKILQDEAECLSGDWRRNVHNIGKKQAQSDGLAIDNQGNLYYGLLPLYGVGKWNIKDPFSSSKIIAEEPQHLVWTDSFAFDNDNSLYLLANNVDKYFNPNYDIDINGNPNFNIVKFVTGTKSYLY